MTASSFYSSEIFQKELENLYSQLPTQDALRKMRAVAWDQFLEIGLPSKHEEAYRYVKLRHLYSQVFLTAKIPKVEQASIYPHVLPECLGSCLVFINGYYQPHLSRTSNLPERLTISRLSDATRTYGAFLNNYWPKAIKEETDPFAILNVALHNDGLFLYLSPKTIVEPPVQILNICDPGEEPMLILPRIQLFVGLQSQIELVVTHACLSGSQYFVNQSIETILEDDAHLKVSYFNPRFSDSAWHFDAFRAVMKRNTTLKVVNVNEGSATLRNDYRVVLKGENSEATLNGIWMLQKKREAHTYVVIDHQAPHCRSRQLFKGVLDDFGSSSFEGKILVRQAADKTDAFQLNNNILLSDRANADSKPNLEIFAADVKASHGATVGQLDKELLFYLKTRGFSDEAAKNILIYGFCQEVIDLLDVSSVRESIKKIVKNFTN
ncbi:MAG TPA: Fe-S cluster assembly protein SufD [Waddliaceae bacterium]